VIHLIPNWRRCYRMFSVQVLAILAGAQTWLLTLDAERLAMPVPIISGWAITQGWVWSDLSFFTGAAIAALGVLGRIIDQGQITEATHDSKTHEVVPPDAGEGQLPRQ
jgi:hypothetical protein